MDKDLNRIAAIEKAIKEKYGDAAVVHPRAEWNDEKEKKYLVQQCNACGHKWFPPAGLRQKHSRGFKLV